MMSSKHLIRALNELNKFLRNFFVKKSFSILVTFLDIHPNKFYALFFPLFYLNIFFSILFGTQETRKGKKKRVVGGRN